MIISRTPLRISIGGGGTDLPSYYERYGGFVISAAITKYVYILINRAHKTGYHIKYSKIEDADEVGQIVHPIVREALKLHKIPSGIEIVSVADIRAGTGLGSSSTFTVGLLNALHALKRQSILTHRLAEEAVDLEMIKLGEPVGKQDHYIAAFGGLTCQEYRRDGTVGITPLQVSDTTLRELSDGLMLFFTGTSRSASVLLADQKKKSESDDKSVLDNLHFIRDLGFRIKGVLEAGNTEEFGRLMHEHWEMKRQRNPGMSSPEIDNAYSHARANGALGGKIVGAGGGGFLMFYTNERIKLRRAMAELGLEEMPFGFDFHGSIIQGFD